MKKLIPSPHYLRLLLSFYLRDKIQSFQKLKKFQSLLSTTKLDRLNITGIYYLIDIYDDNFKLKNNIKMIDQKLQQNLNKDNNYNHNNNNSLDCNKFSLIMNLERIKVLIKYNLPYEEVVQDILEYILVESCQPSQIIILASLLNVKSSYYSIKYNQLIHHVFDVIQEGLQHYSSPSFVYSIFKFITKSQFQIPQKLMANLMRLLDQYIHCYDYQDLSMICNLIFQKSIKQLSIFGMNQTNAFRKRVIYQLMMKKMYNMEMDNLPGKEWSNSLQLQEAIKCSRSIGVKQPFLDIFPKDQVAGQNENIIKLKHPEFLKYYFQNIFTFFRITHRKMDEISLKSILQVLKSLFLRKQVYFTLQFKKLAQRYDINLIKLFIILSQCLNHSAILSQKPSIQTQIYQYMSIVKTYLTPQYLQIHNFSSYNFSDLNYLYQFIYYQLVKNLNNDKFQQKVEPFWDMNIIEQILKLQKQKKYIQSQYNILLSFYRFIKVIIQKKKDNKLGKIGLNNVLAFEIVKIQELYEIAQRNKQDCKDEVNFTDITKSQLQNFYNKHNIYKNVILQPNLQFSYLIAQKQKQVNQILTIFENKGGLINKNTYFNHNQMINQLQNYQNDLTIYSLWKKLFLNSYYKAQYVFCQSDASFYYQFCNKIKNIMEQSKQK